MQKQRGILLENNGVLVLILTLISRAFPCAFLLTQDQGDLAVSDAQEVILEANAFGTKTRYRVQYEGDADSFGWLVVVHGNVAQGDVTESDESIFNTLRERSQPRLITTEIQSGGGSGRGLGCKDSSMKDAGGVFSAEEPLDVTITAEGFAGPFAYQVLSAESGDALSGWLDEEGFSLGDTAETIDEYITEGGYSFVAVTLTPDSSDTPAEGRHLPALSIQSDSNQLHFPARMALSSMSETQRTTIFVLGDNTAEVAGGWNMSTDGYLNSSDADPFVSFEDALLVLGSAELPTYWRTYSGSDGDRWMTRFDTLAPRFAHTVDPLFGFEDRQKDVFVEIEVTDSGSSGAWLLLPLLGLGMISRRRFQGNGI